MEFGPVPSAACAGAILAHSVALPGRKLKKGRFLSDADAKALIDAGIATVTVCRLGDTDVHEDEAAERLAGAAASAGLRPSAPFTGRVNLIAESDGVLVYDPLRLNALNAVDEGITLAALPPYAKVAARQMAATAKIIPFGVPMNALADAEAKAGTDAPLFRIAPFRPARIAVIQTVLDGIKPSVLDKTDAVMASRIAAMGAQLCPPMRCSHDQATLAQSLEAVLAQKAEIVTIIGASAIVDRRDVVPAAIEACGGSIVHFGMPVDPGNLLLMGKIGDIPVIGAPGCVRSPKPNGFDWVLERLVAGVPVDRNAIMGMGAGGFLKEIPIRPRPRAEEEASPSSLEPRIAGLLLAAGQSRRMGPANKLLEDLNGTPMVRHAAGALKTAGLADLTVVTGYQAEAVSAALEGMVLNIVYNPSFADGMATSVKRGVSALPFDIDGTIVALGDMPRIRPDTIARLRAAFDPVEGRSICVPVYNGTRGNPVLFARRFFPEILELSGDQGAKSLIGAYEEHVAEVPVDDPGVLMDVDTPDALSDARSKEVHHD